jgi:hypothetical protein
MGGQPPMNFNQGMGRPSSMNMPPTMGAQSNMGMPPSTPSNLPQEIRQRSDSQNRREDFFNDQKNE